MTLIVSYVSPDYVLQVSDRRLTLPGRRGRVYDDQSNKAVFAFGFSVFAYTGHAYLFDRRLRSDDWFMDQLSKAGGLDVSFDKRMETVGSRLVDVLSLSPPADPPKWVTFVGVGFARVPPHGQRVAFYVRLTNVDSHSNPHSDRFWLKPAMISRGTEVYADGQPIPGEDVIRLRRQIRRARNSGVSSNGIARYLAHFVRQQAKRYPTIGENLMVSYLPMRSVNPGSFMLMGGRPEGAIARFLFLPKTSATPVLYGPNIVANGFVAKDVRYYTPLSARLGTDFRLD